MHALLLLVGCTFPVRPEDPWAPYEYGIDSARAAELQREMIVAQPRTLALRAAMPTRPMPAISQAGAVIALTCATSGASIYYTLDGSWPGSGNPEAVLYSAPVTLEAGSHDLRVAAQKADHSPSIDISQTITVNP